MNQQYQFITRLRKNNAFIHGTVLYAGIALYTAKKDYEILINFQGDELFLENGFNRGIPIDNCSIKMLKKFNELRDKFQQYCITKDNTLWWEIKNLCIA